MLLAELDTLLRSPAPAPDLDLDAFIGPGHVSTVIGCAPYEFIARDYGKPLVQRLSPSPDEITLHPRIGSLALRLCRVAQGSLDAAFAGGQSRDWDLAAANLIVQEADGRMTALSGDAISYNRRDVVHGVLVAAGRDRHARIVGHFKDLRTP